jgi:hypothetical protein
MFVIANSLAAQTFTDSTSETIPNEILVKLHTDLTRDFFDPYSAKYRSLYFGSQNRSVVCGEINAKNRMGGYVGYKAFWYDLTSGASSFDIDPSQLDKQLKGFVAAGCISKLMPGDAPKTKRNSQIQAINLPATIKQNTVICDSFESSGHDLLPGCFRSPSNQPLQVQAIEHEASRIKILLEGQEKYVISEYVHVDCNGVKLSIRAYLWREIPPGTKPCW